MKKENIPYKIEWELQKVVRSYIPGNIFCNLYLEEIHQIMFYNETEYLLNERNEYIKSVDIPSIFIGITLP